MKYKGYSLKVLMSNVSLTLLLFFPLSGYADGSLVSLICPEQVSCDTRISIPLMISNAPAIDALGVEVNWSYQIIFKGCDFEGCLTEGFNFISCNAPEEYRLKFGGFTTQNAIEEGSSGCLVKLEFEVPPHCNPNEFWIVISELFDDLKGMDTASCEPIPLTTTTTTIRRRPTTTTTTIQVCTVSISPQSVTMNSKEAQRFKVLTACDGSVVEGSYKWELSPPSAIGSAITGDGLFFAGNNQTDSDVQETVKVTDTAHENVSAIATITIIHKGAPPPECGVTITPSTVTIYTRETVLFSAQTTCDGEPVEGTYLWSVDSSVGSTIDKTGLYNSALTDTDVTDVVRVTDTANGDSSDTAAVNVIGTYIEVCPDPMLRSYLLWLPVWILVTGTNTHFDTTTTLSYSPSADITPLFQLTLGPEFMWGFVLVNPQFTQTESGSLTITVTTPTVSEAVKDTIELHMLPWILEEKEEGG